MTSAPAYLRPTAATLLGAAMVVGLGALFEEVAFRAGLVGPLRTAFGPWVATTAPAAVFGLFHAANPHANALGVANTVLAGVCLGQLYLDPVGRPQAPSLGLCTGAHAGWNLTLGWVLGVPVSGGVPPARWLAPSSRAALWSGGDYGLEAGLGTTIVFVALVGALGLRLARRSARRLAAERAEASGAAAAPRNEADEP